jgi:pyrimidine-nucleoside phosphorylase
MDEPLGRAVGNAVEVAEAISCLMGEGPEDLVALSVELAAEMVVMGEKARSLDEARAICRRTIADGSALERFRRVIRAQGGDPRCLDDPALLPTARRRIDLPSPRSGYVRSVSARPIGRATMLLGAGRTRVDSPIDLAVGVILHKKTGDPVEVGEPLCSVLVNDTRAQDEALSLIHNAYSIGDHPVAPASLIVERL